MKQLFHKLMPKLLGRNLESTPVNVIIDQMKELRPLPTGMQEFDEWSDRIITGTLLPANAESQKFALATMIMHLSPTQDHECDAYFIKSLRKAAINEIAHAKMTEIRDAAKARLAKEEAEKNANNSQTLLQDSSGTTGAGDDSRGAKEAEQVPDTTHYHPV